MAAAARARARGSAAGTDRTRAPGTTSLVALGRISGVHGVTGWVRVWSDTQPREAILDYPSWWLGRDGEWTARRLEAGRRQGQAVLARLEGVADRDAARALMDLDIAVEREALPGVEEGEYYWCDLVGLEVVTTDGERLGRVERLLETGANDVLVIGGERERLVPFVLGSVVAAVDLEGGAITVDWDSDF